MKDISKSTPVASLDEENLENIWMIPKKNPWRTFLDDAPEESLENMYSWMTPQSNPWRTFPDDAPENIPG